MLTLHIEAKDYKSLVEQVADHLNLAINGPGIMVDPTLLGKDAPGLAPKKGRNTSPKTDTLPAAAEAQAGAAAQAGGAPNNSGTEPAAHSPAEEGGAAAASAPTGTAAPASSELKFDDVKAKLKALSDSPKGGIKKVLEILGNHGLTGANAQIKNLTPEHFATAVEQADAILAA